MSFSTSLKEAESKLNNDILLNPCDYSINKRPKAKQIGLGAVFALIYIFDEDALYTSTTTAQKRGYDIVVLLMYNGFISLFLKS